VTSVRVKQLLESSMATGLSITVAALALALSIGVGVKQYELANCLAKYNNEAALAQQARIVAADEDRAAQDALFRAIAADPRHAIAAVAVYNKARDSADEQRRQHPYPAPPSETC
jgi:hypothetical protein